MYSAQLCSIFTDTTNYTDLSKWRLPAGAEVVEEEEVENVEEGVEDF